MEDALLDQFVGRGTASKVIAQAVLYASVSPKSDVGEV